MAASLSGVYNLQAFTDLGALAVGGRIYTYVQGTTTHKDAFIDFGGATPHTYTSDGIGGMYIALNARGELPAPLYLSAGSYDITYKTAAGASVWTRRADPTADGITAIRTELANAASAVEAAGMVAYDVDIAYATGTVGHGIHGHGRILQGADPTGATDSTTALRALFDLCIPNGYEAVIAAGNYTVSDRISTVTIIAAGSLNLRLAGDVTITVDAGATAFPTLLACYTTAANNISITGGTLTINCSNKAANGLYCRHAATTGGYVKIDSLVVKNCKNNNSGDVNENQALVIFGRYAAGTIGSLTIDTVDRTNTVGGATKGLTIDQIEGPFTIGRLKLRNVLCTGASADADGVFFGAYTSGATYTQRSGSVVVEHLDAEDCQGRSIKCQMQDVSLQNVYIRRKLVNTFSTADIDFQVGGGTVENLFLRYEKDGGTNRIHADFYPISVQQQCTDKPQRTRIANVVLRAEMQLPRLVNLTVGASALAAVTELLDYELIPTGAMSGSHFSRAVFEFDAGQAAAATGTTHIVVTDGRGDFNNVPILGHTTFGASVATKLSWEIVDNKQTGTYAANNRVIGNISGGTIPAVKSFMCRDNSGVTDLMAAGWTFDFQTLPVGCRFHYDINGAVDSNPPGAMAASGIAYVEALGSIGATVGYRSVRVTVDNANAANTVFYTQTGTWGTIK